MDTIIRVATAFLKQPQLFAGNSSSGLCRDLILWVAMENKPVVEFYLPDFCRAFGYNKANLTRRCTPEELEEIRLTGWPKEKTQELYTVLALALVRLVTQVKIGGAQVLQNIDSFKVSKGSGTRVMLTVGQQMLAQNRKAVQVIPLSEYLSLRTGGSEQRIGCADHAARKLFLRLSWQRQQWDYPAKGTDPTVDSYEELLGVAGLDDRLYAPPKKFATQMRHLLERVGKMPSIMLRPTVLFNRGKGAYQVSWGRIAHEHPITTTLCALCKVTGLGVKAVAIRSR